MTEENDTPMPDRFSPLAHLPVPSVSRRRFLVGTGVAAGLALAASACGNDDDEESTGGGQSTQTTQAQSANNDLAVAQLAAGLEKLAVDTYTAALSAATGGKLGTVPDAVAQYVTTAKAHHEVHLSSWNSVLKSAGRPEVTAPNATLKPTVDSMFAQVKDVAGAAKLALTLEDIASQTYNKAIPTLSNKDAVKLAAQIQVVDQQHISILRYALGSYPVGTADLAQTTVTFQPTDKAAAG